MRTSHSGFQHPATPNRNVMTQRDVVDFLCLTEAAHASDLDVQDPAGPYFERKISVSRIPDRFVQTNRALDRFLQTRMKIDFVIP